jgi:hypothetical protein
MATELMITESEVDKRTPPFYGPEDKALIRKAIAREKTFAAISELPGSRYKEILLFMLDEGLV